MADDGAVLSIDNENVIDNDGIHAPTPVATTVKLEKGLHNFRVRYFQGPGPDLALPARCRRSSRRSDRRRPRHRSAWRLVAIFRYQCLDTPA
jgi:hypothetical protein